MYQNSDFAVISQLQEIIAQYVKQMKYKLILDESEQCTEVQTGNKYSQVESYVNLEKKTSKLSLKEEHHEDGSDYSYDFFGEDRY